MLLLLAAQLFGTTTHSLLSKDVVESHILSRPLSVPPLQLGEASGPAGEILLRGPQHQNHHMAEAYGRVRAQLPAVAEPAQPAAGRHAPVQPALPLPGTPGLHWPSLHAHSMLI